MRCRSRLARSLCLSSIAAALFGAVLGSTPATVARAATPHACPAALTTWRAALGAEWLDCHQLTDLTTTGNNFTDPNSLTGMGFPPPGAGSLNSNKTTPTSPPVSGLQLDGYFPDGCNAFQAEPALTAKDGTLFIPGCTPTTNQLGTATCLQQCHHDGQFVIRIPDNWDGHLLTSGTPGIRDAFASDFINSDYAMERGWAYVSQDKGNMGANFYQSGCDETGSDTTSPGCGPSNWPGACTVATHPWCAGNALAEWTFRIRQATRSARALLMLVGPSYSLSGVTFSYVTGISNGGYQTRRALETDTVSDRLYDGGVDWEGTLLTPSVPSGVQLSQPTTGYILFNYLPTSLANAPQDLSGDATAVANLTAVGFNPESQPLWQYHYGIYWGLTQKVYRLEVDPEFTNYTCSDTTGTQPPGCVTPPALAVPSTDPDAGYNYAARKAAVPAIATRIGAAANSGDIQHPLITLHGDQDALLPIKTDSDLYAQMVHLAGHDNIYRYYTVRGGNHVDGQFDDHNGIDTYGNTLLRPILPCTRASLDALAGWVEQGSSPPASHTIPRSPTATAAALANTCDIGTPVQVPEGMPVGFLALGLLVIVGVGLRSVKTHRLRVEAGPIH